MNVNLSYKERFERTTKEWKVKGEFLQYSREEFLALYTRKTLREVMVELFPHIAADNPHGCAFAGMTKNRMYKHISGLAVLHNWIKDNNWIKK